MVNIILQPASATISRKHYFDTVETPVDMGLIESYVSKQEYKTLEDVTENSKVCVWGVVPSMKNIWDKMNYGDTILFARDNTYFSKTRLLYKT